MSDTRKHEPSNKYEDGGKTKGRPQDKTKSGWRQSGAMPRKKFGRGCYRG